MFGFTFSMRDGRQQSSEFKYEHIARCSYFWIVHVLDSITHWIIQKYELGSHVLSMFYIQSRIGKFKKRYELGSHVWGNTSWSNYASYRQPQIPPQWPESSRQLFSKRKSAKPCVAFAPMQTAWAPLSKTPPSQTQMHKMPRRANMASMFIFLSVPTVWSFVYTRALEN